MDGPRRSPRLRAKPQQQAQQPPRNRPRDPTFTVGSVPAAPRTWVQCEKNGVTFRAQYGSAGDEETVRVQHRDSDGKWSNDDTPTEQKGYARLQVAVDGARVEVRRARLFAYLVLGPPPGNPARYEADHETKVNGVWARRSGPVAWLTKEEHGAKHGAEGAAAAQKRRRDEQATGSAAKK